MIRSLVLLFILASVGSAAACPTILREVKTRHLGGSGDLCALADRYERVKTELRDRGYSEPDRIANVLAPRFINLPDWEKAKASGKTNPWKVYSPAPTTWGKWEVGRAGVDDLAQKELRSGAFAPLTPNQIIALQARALTGLTPRPGQLRIYGAVGDQFLDTDAITRAEIEKLDDPAFMTPMEPGVRLVRWIATKCVDQDYLDKPHPPKPPRIPANQYFRDAKGVERQCGYYLYDTDPRDVPHVFGEWAARSSDELAMASKDPASSDFVEAIAKAERWFIAIHPFEDGNGRMSRFIVDYSLESVGLPTPILADQNQDLTLRENEWADQIGRGMLRHVEVLESCRRNSRQMGCQQVDHEAPFMFFWEK